MKRSENGPTAGGLGAYGREVREGRGLTQAEVEQRAGVPQSYVSNIERGRTALPSADYRRRLARALGVTHVDLLIAAGEVTPGEVAEALSRDDATAATRAQAQGRAHALVQSVTKMDTATLSLIGQLASVDRETLRLVGELEARLVEDVL